MSDQRSAPGVSRRRPTTTCAGPGPTPRSGVVGGEEPDPFEDPRRDREPGVGRQLDRVATPQRGHQGGRGEPEAAGVPRQQAGAQVQRRPVAGPRPPAPRVRRRRRRAAPSPRPRSRPAAPTGSRRASSGGCPSSSGVGGSPAARTARPAEAIVSSRASSSGCTPATSGSRSASSTPARAPRLTTTWGASSSSVSPPVPATARFAASAPDTDPGRRTQLDARSTVEPGVQTERDVGLRAVVDHHDLDVSLAVGRALQDALDGAHGPAYVSCEHHDGHESRSSLRASPRGSLGDSASSASRPSRRASASSGPRALGRRRRQRPHGPYEAVGAGQVCEDLPDVAAPPGAPDLGREAREVQEGVRREAASHPVPDQVLRCRSVVGERLAPQGGVERHVQQAARQPAGQPGAKVRGRPPGAPCSDV